VCGVQAVSPGSELLSVEPDPCLLDDHFCMALTTA
jgi:hypothetical protein